MAFVAPLVTAIVVALAPGEQGPTTEATPMPAPQPIVGGERTGELEYGSVVALLTSQSGLCTGTVVAPRLILTAAHCLYTLPFGADVDVYYGNELHFDMSAPAVGYGFHPEFCDDCKEDIHDYGYVLLGSDFVPPDDFILPITDQDEWDQTMREGGEVLLVGFGEDPDEASPSESLGIKREVTTSIRSFSPLGTEFFAGGDGHDSCQGDSGGPALVRLSDGTLRLAGITSRGSDPCGRGGYYGAPFPALGWLRDETGIDLLPEGCADDDCVDITPPAEQEGRCAVARHEGREAVLALLPWLLLPGLRRRARARS